MDKQQAQKIIRDTFENPFDKGRFTGFIKNLLNRIDEGSFTYQGSYIPDAYRQYIKTLERIGKFSDGESRLDLLIITLQKETSLERARTMQRNFIAWYLNGSRGGDMKDAALVAYVSPDQADWRFSLVKMDYRFEKTKTGKMKVKEEFTPARRWSFLVGEHEKSHTAQSRLVNILADDEEAPTLAELEKAFDIETVTKEFFLKYRELFLHTKEALDKVVKNNPNVKADFESKGVDTVNFAKKLLGQIVFLYFLQKKGWFGVGLDDDWGTGSKHFLRQLFKRYKGESDTGIPACGSQSTDKNVCATNNFFNDILEPLFYEALRIDRSHDDDYYSRFNCKIPFLNGGLFDPIGNYDWVHTDIHLPDELFSNFRKTKEGDEGDGILDVFDRYNFTVREDEPLEKEVAIDPELLGKAYEKFNAIRPDNFDEFTKALKSGKKGEENKFNKKFGVYYTPREIVHYMCKQSLINYLFTRAEEVELSGAIKKQDIEDLIEVGEMITEHEATALIKQEKIKNGSQKSTEYTALLSDSIRQNAAAIDNWLADITVCDPAVGSGAFPVGMMNEIVRTRNVLSVFLNNKKRNDYEFKRRCIEHSLYGVDIDPGAVEIAKLRLWLSLVVDEEDIKDIKPLPNLDYRIMQGNSLISEFMGINFDDDESQFLKERIAALEIEEKRADKQIKEKEKEQIQFYNKYNQQDQYLSKQLNELNKNKDKIRIKIRNHKAEIKKNNSNSNELSESLKKFKQKKDEFLNESNVTQKAKLKDEVENLLVRMFETKLKTQKAEYFKKLKGIENKYSVLPNQAQREEMIGQEKQKLNKESGFDLVAAEEQLKGFTSGRKLKPFFLWNLYFSEVFHEKGGFDVVIANPPYGADIPKSQLVEIKKQIKDTNNSNSAAIFIDFAKNKFTQKSGVVTFIVPKSLLYSERWFSLVQKLSPNTSVLVDVEKGFENVLLEQVVFVYNHAQNFDKYQAFKFQGNTFSEKALIPVKMVTLFKAWLCDVSLSELTIATRIKRNTKILSDICFTKRGLPLQSKLRQNGDIPLIGGKEIQRYSIIGVKGYLRKKEILSSKKGENLLQPKILSQNIVAHIENPEPHIKITCAVDTVGNVMSVDTINNTFITDKTFSILYVLAMLNSKLISWYAYRFIYASAIRTMHFDNYYIGKIPILIISKSEQNLFIDIVDQILAITKDADYLDNPAKQAQVREYEKQIDRMVYALYGLTEEEIKIVEGETN